jgi:histidyl-tRNA synthetase
MNKISKDEYSAELSKILYGVSVTEGLEEGLRSSDVKQLRPEAPLRKIIETLSEVGITNVKFDKMLARGFDYYTGTIFEIFEVDKDGNSTGRSLLGGGRYDNLTSMFSDQPISGIGFGMGDVTMRDFLDTHKLIPTSVHTTAPKLVMIPTDGKLNLEAQKIAQVIRTSGISVSTDIGTKKIGKKISDAASKGAAYTIVVGTDELSTGRFTLKNLADGSEINETIEKLFPTQIVPN